MLPSAGQEFIKENVGYEFFVPYGFLNDLQTALYVNLLSDNISIKLYEQYMQSSKCPADYFNFIVALAENTDKTEPVVAASYKILKTLAGKMNLRALDQGAVYTVNECIDNFVEQPNIETVQLLTELGCTYQDLARLFNVKQFIREAEISVSKSSGTSTLRKYRDVLKTAKANLHRPDFQYKVVSKQLRVQDIPVSKPTTPLVLIEDTSESSVNLQAQRAMLYVHLLKDDRTLLVYTTDGKEHILKTYEEKYNYFTRTITFKTGRINYNNLINKITKNHPGVTIYILTDVMDYVSPKTYSCTLHLITNNLSTLWQRLIKINNGEYRLI